MPSKKSPKPKEGGRSFMYPSLHRSIAEAVTHAIEAPTFHRKYSGKDADKDYSTNIMGTFTCPNDSCRTKGWASKKVTILIRRYPGNEYNALVFNQRCRECIALGALTVDETSYVDRVAYRLLKWGGARVAPPEYEGKAGKPHKSDLCEGCKRGICQRGAV